MSSSGVEWPEARVAKDDAGWWALSVPAWLTPRTAALVQTALRHEFREVSGIDVAVVPSSTAEVPTGMEVLGTPQYAAERRPGEIRLRHPRLPDVVELGGIHERIDRVVAPIHEGEASREERERAEAETLTRVVQQGAPGQATEGEADPVETILADRSRNRAPVPEFPTGDTDGPRLRDALQRLLGAPTDRVAVGRRLGVPKKASGWWFALGCRAGESNVARFVVCRGVLIGTGGELWETTTNAGSLPDGASVADVAVPSHPGDGTVRALPAGHVLPAVDVERIRRAALARVGHDVDVSLRRFRAGS